MTILPAQPVFEGNHFRIWQKVFTLPWCEYCIEHRSGAQLGFARRKYRYLFNLGTDIRVYSDKTASKELFSIKQSPFSFEWGTTFDVVDSTTGQPLGVIRRSIFGSFATREWSLVDVFGQELGRVRKKFYFGFFTPHYLFLEFGNNEAGTVVLSPGIAPKVSLDLSAVPIEKLDRRVAIAFALLLLAMHTQH